MRPQVLIIAHANPSWTQFYIEAFREIADVLFIGQPMHEETQRRWFGDPTIDSPSPLGRGAGVRDLPSSVVPDIPIDFASMPLRERVLGDCRPDLVVGISRVGGHPLPGLTGFACPTALITVDTWQCIIDYPQARNYDYVFAAQREFVPRLQAIGARNVSWLPLACAPNHHRPGAGFPSVDIAFGGSLSADIHHRRRALIDALTHRFSVQIEADVFGDRLCELYAQGRLGFNHCAVDEINMRVFEVMAMGRPLLVNRGPERNGLLDLFEDGLHLIVYDEAGDLLEKVAHYLGDRGARDRITQEGQHIVLEKHTYRHRAETILRLTLGDTPARQTWRDRERLVDFLPHGMGRVLDVGMRLESSRFALRKRGATEVVGIAETPASHPRKTSFDVVSAWPPQGVFDTVVVSDPAFWGKGVDEVMGVLKDCTPAGAVLIARAPDALAGASATAALESSCFHLAGIEACAAGPVLVARRFTHSIRQVVFDTFASHPETGYDPADIAGRVPDGL